MGGPVSTFRGWPPFLALSPLAAALAWPAVDHTGVAATLAFFALSALGVLASEG
jgi:hypothetical protein